MGHKKENMNVCVGGEGGRRRGGMGRGRRMYANINVDVVFLRREDFSINSTAQFRD